MHIDRKKLIKNLVILLSSIVIALILSVGFFFYNRFINQDYNIYLYLRLECFSECDNIEIDEKVHDNFINEILDEFNLRKVADQASKYLDYDLYDNDIESMLTIENKKDHVTIIIKYDDIKVNVSILQHLFKDYYIFNGIEYKTHHLERKIIDNSNVRPYLNMGLIAGLLIGLIIVGVLFNKDEKDLGGYVNEEI